jgi:hypothetical protein
MTTRGRFQRKLRAPSMPSRSTSTPSGRCATSPPSYGSAPATSPGPSSRPPVAPAPVRRRPPGGAGHAVPTVRGRPLTGPGRLPARVLGPRALHPPLQAAGRSLPQAIPMPFFFVSLWTIGARPHFFPQTGSLTVPRESTSRASGPESAPRPRSALRVEGPRGELSMVGPRSDRGDGAPSGPRRGPRRPGNSLAGETISRASRLGLFKWRGRRTRWKT